MIMLAPQHSADRTEISFIVAYDPELSYQMELEIGELVRIRIGRDMFEYQFSGYLDSFSPIDDNGTKNMAEILLVGWHLDSVHHKSE